MFSMSSMHWPFLILLAAVVLLVLEIFIPSGGILGVLAATAFVAAIGTAFAYGGLQLGTAFMGVTAVLLPVVIALMIKLWPKTPFGKRMLIQPPDAARLLPDKHRERQQLVGQRGLALTALLPAGAIRLQGRTLDAISDGVPIEKGTAVEVIAVRNNAIVVRPAPTTPPTSSSSASEPRGGMDVVVPDPFDDSLS
jgi:membrane-bound ClpP family serine protease